MEKEELIQLWKRFTEKNDFKLNDDIKHVEFVAEGVLQNEKNSGLKLCPCRISFGTYENNLELLCPCNFKTHTTWEKEGRCWCGLFWKK